MKKTSKIKKKIAELGCTVEDSMEAFRFMGQVWSRYHSDKESTMNLVGDVLEREIKKIKYDLEHRKMTSSQIATKTVLISVLSYHKLLDEAVGRYIHLTIGAVHELHTGGAVDKHAKH